MKKILSAIVSLSLFCPICDVHAVRKLESFYLGVVAKHIHENDKRNFKQVSGNCSDGLDYSGYVNRYLELYDKVMHDCEKSDKYTRYYKITTPKDFLEIYNLLNNTQFKVLRTDNIPDRNFIYIEQGPETRRTYYVLFPRHYTNLETDGNGDYYAELKLKHQYHLESLRMFERMITRETPHESLRHCIRPEVFFQIYFTTNHGLSCTDPENQKTFTAKLQDFLVKQNISWVNSMSEFSKIGIIPNLKKLLSPQELDYLIYNLSDRQKRRSPDIFGLRDDIYRTSYPGLIFRPREQPEDVLNGDIYDFQIEDIIAGLWNKNKLTKKYTYVKSVGGKKMRISSDADGKFERDQSKFSTLKDWKTYDPIRRTLPSLGSANHPVYEMCNTGNLSFDWLCGLDYKNFQKDFTEVVGNCDTYKLTKIKNHLLESFEYLLGIKKTDCKYNRPTLQYLGEVLFEDENDATCVSYDGILNLLYIFDFFKFPTDVTNKIIEYVLSKTIEKCKKTTTLYNADKFKKIAKLVKKLWDWNIKNKNSSDSQKSIVSEILENYESNTLNNIINKAN